MIERRPSPDSQYVLVTFRLPGATWAERVNLVGDFNDWDTRATPMVQNSEDYGWSVTLKLEAGREYQFRYLIDGKEWLNDWYADKYVPNAFGSENSVIIL
ncbi:MAG: isoamylase early set domain-containing protein [Anaerolineae bacterium]|nr:isoamylase early set domain-containing protein [Anaerolineae bacterium]